MKLTILFILLFSFVPSSETHSKPKDRISGPFPDDDFMALLNPLGPSYNIVHLDQMNLTKGKANFEPWASSYWPIHRGILAYRYPDKADYNSKAFIDNYRAFHAVPSENYIVENKIDRMSPSEKYDLLVGDRSWTLTRAMWKKGYDDYQEKGVVAGWTGICHGWSAIAQRDVLPPKHGVVMRDATNSFNITFFESDIKGLISYLWAESPPETKQAGHRCYKFPIERDTMLRPIDVSCLDTNPMTWHLSITNRLGHYGKGFVMDSSVGAEVWNYPITAYDYSYFSARTFEPVHSLKSALVPIAELSNDRFASVRNEKTKFVVGVIMDVFHPSLIEPTTSPLTANVYQTHTFIYDLELDENYDVIGGEWYSEDQPDFIWTFADDLKARTREDLQDFGVWDGNGPLPANIAQSAVSASQRGKVMATIVDKLHSKSLE
ncbi:MAG: hypothetical protein JNM24_18835 [Bdellovibrionaceae bacterium]|jgi:hypothetical protein|nr:hypothetical protein [Pseudobdellovibrionaceae bacterium]